MQKSTGLIFGARSFAIVILVMVSLLQSCRHCGNAWVFDNIASNYQKQQVQILVQKCHRHYYQKRLLKQWRNVNTRSVYGYPQLSFNPIHRFKTVLPMSTSSTTTTAVTSERSKDPSDQIKNEINQRIYSVARNIFNLSANQITITWKSKRIVVTVHTVNAFLNTSQSDDDDIDEDEIEIDFIDEEDFLDDDDDREENLVENTFRTEKMENEIDDTDNEDFVAENSSSTNTLTTAITSISNSDVSDDDTTTTSTTADSVDLALFARSINAALDDGDDGIATRITHQYDIEVSTPGINSDDITTPRMFAAYRGFDVIVHYFDPKKKVLKQHEGRLVEKNEEHVIINQKGRMKHFKNIHVQAVKLPKFKNEKGSR